jgi:hypothetical protein
MVLGHAAMFGVVHEADEGTAAHVFQLLMAAQVPLQVLALQGVAALAAIAAAFFLT